MVEEIKEVTTVSTSTPKEQEVVKTTKVIPPPVKIEHPQQVYDKKKAIFRTYQVAWYILAIVEILLGFRVALKALGANPLSGFTSFIYLLSDPLAYPFSGILRTTINKDSIFEWSTLVAAIVYALVAFGIVQLMQFMKPVTPHEVEKTVDNT